MKVLAGDIGGTRARLLLAEVEGPGRFETVLQEEFDSGAFASADRVLAAFLERAPARPEVACLAVAGPVRDNRARITNLPWLVDGDALAREFGLARCTLVNDLAGIARGLDWLEPEGISTLQAGVPEAGGVRAVIAPGTGLGAALLVPCGDRSRVVATEYGHTDFAPVDDLEADLAAWWRRRAGRATVEHVISGPGLAHLVAFLRESGRGAPGPELERAMAEGDPPAAVSRAALAHADPVAVQALDLWVACLAAAAGNLALSCLPAGGLYIAGGVAPHVRRRLEAPDFLRRFRAKPPMTPVLEAIPVRLVLDTRAGTLGALACALEPA